MKSAFLADDAKRQVTEAIRHVESQTSAEVVVTVRTEAGSYRDADYLVGFLASFAALLVFLFHPAEFDTDTMPIDSLAAFVIGAVLSAVVVPLRRLFVSTKRIDRNVATLARSAFVDLGVSKTSGRNGILVLVALFERRAFLVPDIGVDVAKLGAAYETAVLAMNEAVRRNDVAAFVSALRSLGPVLGAAMPHSDDDVNELPDEVATA
jgi:putative membrane protein